MCTEQKKGRGGEHLHRSFRSVQHVRSYARATHPCAADVTPHEYIAALITDRGVLTAPYDASLVKASMPVAEPKAAEAEA